jgi:hypothetical protein
LVRRSIIADSEAEIHGISGIATRRRSRAFSDSVDPLRAFAKFTGQKAGSICKSDERGRFDQTAQPFLNLFQQSMQ